ncbi:MAG TPA: PilX N-terminal domain-containing pilus assembly protein [Gemmatimonadaceae bacterium]|nr:PilX N-terminal domain-containing pilus assembly protein [Gemmatimonadaceae bacterium]
MTNLNRKGFVLPTVIFAITIMSIVAVVAVSTATDERRTSRASRESTLAMYAAEAGLRQTYGAWPAGAQLLTPGDSLDLGWNNLPNKASYRAVIHRVDKGGLQEYAVIVQGRRTDPTAGIMMLAGAVGAVPTFKYAVSTDSALYLVNGGLFDGYDSEKAAYISTSADSTANLRAGVDIYITQTLVKGDVAAVGVVTLASGGLVTGTNTPAAPVVPPRDVIPCPVTGFTPTAKVPTGSGISYNAVSGVLSVSGNNNSVTLTDTAYFFSSIVVSNNAKLILPGTQHVNLVLRDSLNASGGNVINQSNSPPMVSFSSCGTSATPAYWALSSGAWPGYFSVYAPNHVVYELGGGDFYGAIVAWIYYATGGGKFHYDAALARQPSNRLEVQRGSWAQLPGS